MSNEKDRVYCTIDHTNKHGDGRNFDPYEFWLKQMRLRQKMEASATHTRNNNTRRKSQLT